MSVDCASMTSGTSGEAPVETPTEAPADDPVEAWVEAQAEAPSVEAPVEPPAEAAAEALDEAPAEALDEAPAEALVETPLEPPAEAAAEALPEALVEALVEAPETPVNVVQSLGVVGYAAFALLRPVPLCEIVPFPVVVNAFEAEAGRQVVAPPAPAPEPASAPAPEDIVPDFTASAPQAALSYAVGGYRPSPGPQMWGRELPEPASAPDSARHEVVVPVDDSVLPETAAPDELDGDAPGATGMPVGGPFDLGGYAADRASADRQARAVLDELSFLFDGN